MIRSNRTLVVLVALTLGLSAVAVGASAAAPGPADQSAASADVAQVSNSSAMDVEDLTLDVYNDGTYAVEQGEQCVPIEPLGGGYQTAEEYYDYRHPETTPSAYTYSSHGTTHLQADDTSRLFLYDGDDGLSLMVVHGRLDGFGDGGSVTMVFDDLPAEGEWTVTDDQYDLGNGSENDDVWNTGEDASRISWVWTDSRTDGGAYTGLGDDFAMTIQPRFNEVADLQQSDGTVEAWEVLSGDERDPRGTSLNMTEPVEIRTGTCSAVTDVEVDETTDGSATINATVTNDGSVAETVTVPIAVGGEVVDERDLTIDPNEEITFNTSAEHNGTSQVSVGSQTATVDADDDDGVGGFADGLPGFGVPVAIGALLTVLALRIRR